MSPLDGATAPPGNWKPTQKFWAAASGAVAAIAASTIATGWDSTERGMVAAAVVSLTALYWKRDEA